MVNNRELLKTNVEADLHKKIQLAQDVLAELRGAVQRVEDSSAKAKGQVKKKVESIQQLIGSRKLELTRQIDIICHTQVNALQEEIRAIYIALGSFQSTLFNLDSFDHNQLLSLHIPDLSRAKSSNFPPPLELNVEDAAIKEQLNHWGNVNANGLKGLFDIGSSVSLPRRFVEYNDTKNAEFMCHKSVSTDASIVNFTKQPKLPNTNSSSCTTPASMSFDITTPTPDVETELWSVDKWLSGIKFQTCPENEDFEIVSIENPSEIHHTDMNDWKLDGLAGGSDSKTVDDDDSSIVCLENENSKTNNDLSKWLKPKKLHKCPNSTASSTSEMQTNSCKNAEEKCASAYSHNPSKNRFVDFPCLRQDFKTWKKNRSSNIIPLTINDKGIFPPEYALPAAFWLKKYR